MTELEFKFEDCPVRTPGPIQQFSGALAGIMSLAPAALPALSASRAEYMSSGLFDSDIGLWSNPAALEGARRIASIEHDGSPLLQYRYDDEGRLAETVFPGDRIERYVRDRDGFVTAVTWCGEDSARFERRDDGRLSAVTYTDGASFRFTATSEGLIERLRYPDGAECVLRRDGHGLLESVTCRHTTIRYEWSDDAQLTAITTETPVGASRLVLGRRRLEVAFEPEASRRSSVQQARSALGLWTLDQTGVPIELISPFDIRLCRTHDRTERTTMFSSPAGQTTWRFTRSGVLDSKVGAGGTRTLYFPLGAQGDVLALSYRNVEFLHYESGLLVGRRSIYGEHTRFTYKPSGSLSSVGIRTGMYEFLTSATDRLLGLRCAGAFSADLAYGTRTLKLARIRGKKKSPLNTLNALSTTATWLWEWPDYSTRNRQTISQRST